MGGGVSACAVSMVSRNQEVVIVGAGDSAVRKRIICLN
jgi:thioredoxin reductase